MTNVLVTCPMDSRKIDCLQEFSEHVTALHAKGCEVIIINTDKDKEYGNIIQKNMPFCHVEYMPKSESVSKTRFMYNMREEQRRLFLSGDSDYMLMLDSDVMFTVDLYDEALEHMERGEHWVGPWYIMGYGKDGIHTPPESKALVALNCRLIMGNDKKKGIDSVELDELKTMPRTFKCEAIPLGCCFVDRKIMEDMPFEYCPWMPVGEDVMWYGNAAERGYKALCINQEVDHYSNFASQNYYSDMDAMRLDIITRVGDDICKNVDLKKLREGVEI